MTVWMVVLLLLLFTLYGIEGTFLSLLKCSQSRPVALFLSVDGIYVPRNEFQGLRISSLCVHLYSIKQERDERS